MSTVITIIGVLLIIWGASVVLGVLGQRLLIRDSLTAEDDEFVRFTNVVQIIASLVGVALIVLGIWTVRQ